MDGVFWHPRRSPGPDLDGERKRCVFRRSLVTRARVAALLGGFVHGGLRPRPAGYFRIARIREFGPTPVVQRSGVRGLRGAWNANNVVVAVLIISLFRGLGERRCRGGSSVQRSRSSGSQRFRASMGACASPARSDRLVQAVGSGVSGVGVRPS